MLKANQRLGLFVLVCSPAVVWAQAPDCCGAPLNYHFTLERVSDTFLPNERSPQTTADFPELGPQCLASDLGVELVVPSVDVAPTVEVYLNVIAEDTGRLFPDPDDAVKRGRGIQGWAVGVAIPNSELEFADLSGDGVADGFLIANTAADINPLWGGVGFGGGSAPSLTKLSPSLFFRANIGSCCGGSSEYFAMILAFVNCLDGCDPLTQFGEFPSEGTESLIRLAVTLRTPIREFSFHRRAIKLQDGLRAEFSQVPVENVFTIAGEGFQACNLNYARFLIDVRVEPPQSFVRCDANDDGQFNLADVVRMIDVLFREPQALSCVAAVDCNGADGTNDALADVVYALQYLFSERPATARTVSVVRHRRG